jgi:hypothetical protein
MAGWVDNSASNIWQGGGWPSDTQLTDNIFMAMDGAQLAWVEGEATRLNNLLDGNLYFSSGRRKLFSWGGRRSGPRFWMGDAETGSFPPTNFDDLAAFQKASKQEGLGLWGDPQLANVSAGDYGRLPLDNYRQKAESPAFNGGKGGQLDADWLKGRRAYLSETGAEAYGIPMEPKPADTDYWGKKLEAAAKAFRGPQAP